MRGHKWLWVSISIIVSTGISYLSPLLLSLSTKNFLDDESIRRYIGLGGLIGAIILVVLQEVRTYLQVQEVKGKSNTEELKDLLVITVKYIVKLPSTRASIFIVTQVSDEQRLSFLEGCGVFNAQEKSLQFRFSEGLVGLVKTCKQPQSLDLPNLSRSELVLKLKYTDGQVSCLSHLRSIVGIPIFSLKGDDEIRGVLIVDSLDPLDISCLDTDNMKANLADMAGELSKLLPT